MRTLGHKLNAPMGWGASIDDNLREDTSRNDRLYFPVFCYHRREVNDRKTCRIQEAKRARKSARTGRICWERPLNRGGVCVLVNRVIQGHVNFVKYANTLQGLNSVSKKV